MSLDHKGINNHVVQYLDYYCGLETEPKFAVLLKGEWGAGKTWFIKNYKKNLDEGEEKKKCFYISLYGITSFEEIQEELFLEQLPIKIPKGLFKTAKSVGTALKSLILKPDSNLGANPDVTATFSVPPINLTEFLTSLKGSILIFDDLERCGIDIANILGFINNFVEHQGLKVIIIANEDKLSVDKDNEDNAYDSIKEKLIGKTLTVKLDFEGAVTSFITLIKNSDAQRFLSDRTELIENIYQVAKYENLRTLRQVILDFERIFKSLSEEIKSNPEALEVLLRLLIIFSIEIKRNHIKPKKIASLKQENNSIISRQTQQNTQEKKWFDKLLEKYADSKFKNYQPLNAPFPSFAWWGEFLDKGILDKEKLEESVITTGYFPDKNTPDWVKLWHYSRLEDDEFENILNEVESKYFFENSSDESINIKEIQQVLGLFLLFADAGLYSKTKQEILESFKLFTKKLNESNKLSIPLLYAPSSLREIDNYVGVGLGFQGNEFEEFINFSTYIEEVRKEAIARDLPSVAQKLLDVMGEDVWQFHKMVVREKKLPVFDEENGKYADVPVLKYIEEASFLEKFLQLSHKNKRTICYALDNRHNSRKKDLLEELDWLKSILKLVEKEAASKEGKLSGYLLNSLIEGFFKKTISKIETHARRKE